MRIIRQTERPLLQLFGRQYALSFWHRMVDGNDEPVVFKRLVPGYGLAGMRPKHGPLVVTQ